MNNDKLSEGYPILVNSDTPGTIFKLNKLPIIPTTGEAKGIVNVKIKINISENLSLIILFFELIKKFNCEKTNEKIPIKKTVM